jgi:hypothetical protein
LVKVRVEARELLEELGEDGKEILKGILNK